jgi:XTP/dITP diphosphohydrolase
MKRITFVTGNTNKLYSAQTILHDLGYEVIQQVLDIPEIQAETGEPIIRDKAQKAYEILQIPLVVTDDSWLFPGLRGFPGPYMKSINHWFTPEDFLNLTAPLADRRAILHQHLLYQDHVGQHLFMAEIPGTLQREARGSDGHESAAYIISLQKDGKTIAEVRDDGRSAIADTRTAWHIFAEWLVAQKT